MRFPTTYTVAVSIPLPAEEMVRAVVGAGYDPSTALNVIKMFAGTEVMFQALIGMSGTITVAPIGARENEHRFERANGNPRRLTASQRRAAVERTWHPAPGAA
jgi:hypothetical protein